MLEDDLFIESKVMSVNARTKPPTKRSLVAKAHGISVISVADETKLIKLILVIHAPSTEHNLVSVSSQCEDVHAVKFTNKVYAVK